MKKDIRTEFNNVIRNEFIKNHPTCQYCGSPAEHVHHLIPIAAGGDNRESNLIPLCLKCHGLIHNKHFNPDWKELQKIGIEKAKKEGKFKGGQIKRLNKKEYFILKEKYSKREINKTQFANLLKVSRPTLNKILEKEEEYLKVMT